MAVPKVVTISNLKVLQRSWAKQTNQTVMAVGSWTLSILHSLVADRFLEKNKKYRAPAVSSVFPKRVNNKKIMFLSLNSLTLAISRVFYNSVGDFGLFL
jgi:hypothetical protein